MYAIHEEIKCGESACEEASPPPMVILKKNNNVKKKLGESLGSIPLPKKLSYLLLHTGGNNIKVL